MYTKIISSKRKISDIRDYLEQDKKVKEKTRNIMETKLNCFTEDWAKEMEDTATFFGKNDGVKYHQIILSSDPSQVPPPDIKTVHRAGVEVAKMFADKGFQAVVETHNDVEQIHDHIVVGAVNIDDGHKLQISKAKTAQRAKKADFRFVEITNKVDEICHEYGLLTLTESKAKKTEKQKRLGEQPTNQLNIYVKESYQQAMQTALSGLWKKQNIFDQDDFTKALEEKGIRITRITSKGKITYQDIKGHKVRADRIGAFNRDDITNLIELNRELKAVEEEKERREGQKQAIREAAEKEAAIAAAKAEAELQQRLEQAQQAAAQVAAKKAKEVEKARIAKEKERLINAINRVMQSKFTTIPEWKKIRQDLNIHVSNDGTGNLIYSFENSSVSVSSKDHPAFSKKAIVSKAGENKIAQEKTRKEKEKTRTRTISKNKGRSR